MEFEYCPDAGKLNDVIGDADVFVGSMTADLFAAAQQLKWIQSSSSGVDYYLGIAELAASDVLLTSASGNPWTGFGGEHARNDARLQSRAYHQCLPAASAPMVRERIAPRTH